MRSKTPLTRPAFRATVSRSPMAPEWRKSTGIRKRARRLPDSLYNRAPEVTSISRIDEVGLTDARLERVWRDFPGTETALRSGSCVDYQRVDRQTGTHHGNHCVPRMRSPCLRSG
jgi:hypothetical protein